MTNSSNLAVYDLKDPFSLFIQTVVITVFTSYFKSIWRSIINRFNKKRKTIIFEIFKDISSSSKILNKNEKLQVLMEVFKHHV